MYTKTILATNSGGLAVEIGGRAAYISRRGALSLREKRSSTKLKNAKAVFSLSAGVFPGPLWEIYAVRPYVHRLFSFSCKFHIER